MHASSLSDHRAWQGVLISESPEEIYARVVAAVGGNGRLPMPLAVEWNEMLPPGPRDVWEADIQSVAAKLATHDGRALV